ncbi:ABC transporter permease [Microvirga brassicacearum]|uniref:ABC transporter permease n=1 Tax=Microvirga brassicacearum TaxID=2580413 RepID=A0A5N3PBZ7_9HYPH|nr:ABC transporter permease [Microvirga brassicacearum]KAB0267239.1 ABC transporter permease [Microvirga brassicacearum]
MKSATAPVPARALSSISARSKIDLRLLVPGLICVVYVVVAIIGPFLTRYDPVATNTSQRLRPPFSELRDGSIALFGTDQVGRDLLGQVIAGAQISLTVGFLTLVIAGILGTALGVLAGYRGGWVDTVLMRLADIQLAFPSILLAVLVAAVVGPSLLNIILVLAFTRWVVFARVARAQTLAVKNRDFVSASRTLGAGDWHIVRHCILPALVAPVLVVATVQFGLVIVAEASLSFLGLGMPAGTPSWGVSIASGRNYLATAWWISTMPGLVLSALVIAVGVLGDRLRDRFDPNLTTR